METPACDPMSLRFARLMAAILMKSCARAQNAANVAANGTQPRACMPRAAAAICCSAMNISKNRSGCWRAKSCVRVESLTSPSSTTTSGRAAPSAARAAPNAVRVATCSPGSYSGRTSRLPFTAAAAVCRPAGVCGGCTGTWMLRISPSSAMASSVPGSGLPCAPSASCTAATPRPFMVRARIAVGAPRVSSASVYAASMASTSCPSISIVCQPNAPIRRA